jgi:conjugal transfer ATP-binding protein TraC
MSHISKQPIKPRKVGSVQQSFVGARAVSNDILCLAAPGGGIEYAAVIQVEGLCYALKGEDERVQLSDFYQALLCGLAFPIQIVLRSLPLQLDDYLRPFQSSAETQVGSEQEAARGSIWRELAQSHVAFLRRLAESRTLLDRRIYLIIRSSPPAMQHPSPLRSLLGLGPKSAAVPRRENLERARAELHLRVGELIRLLENMGLATRRLTGRQELVSFYSSCLTELRTRTFPLPSAVIESIDRPISPAKRRPRPIAGNEAELSSDLPTSREDEGRLTALTSVVDLLAPAAVELHPDYLRMEDEYAQVIVVRQVPRVVTDGWLIPLIELDEALEISLVLRPLRSDAMIRLLRRKEMELSSSALLAQRKGGSVDPEVQVAREDIASVIGRLASGEERMLDVTLLVLVRGASRREMQGRAERVRAVLQNMLLVARPALYQQRQAFLSCLPHARSLLGEGMLLDSRSVATAFPFASSSLFHPRGVLEGVSQTGELVVVDAWNLDNANRLVLGPPGVGKSHAVKTHIMRAALRYAHEDGQAPLDNASSRFQIIVIDPEKSPLGGSEYGRMAAALGGQIVRLAPGSPHHINPFDLPLVERNQYLTPEEVEGEDWLADHIQHLHTLLEIMLADHTTEEGGRLTTKEKGYLDAALYQTYRKYGLTRDRRTHARPAPLMKDLYEVMKRGEECGPDPSDLVGRLRRYVEGSLAGLFSGSTTVGLENSVVVFDVHRVERELQPVGLWLVTNYVWTQTLQNSIPRELIVDELATLYRFESGAEFLEDLFRRARKYFLGITGITQHPSIFEQSAIPSNAAVHILMRQSASALDQIQRLFKLSARETQLLRRLQKGEALLTVNEKRLLVRFDASRLEHVLATTDPRELQVWQTDPEYRDLREMIGRLLAFDPEAVGDTLRDLAELTG